MLKIGDYFGKWINHSDVTEEVEDNAMTLVEKVNDLLEEMFADGVDFHLNPSTNSYISGKTYGGFRPQDCPQGAHTSSHKTGQGVDLYDPKRELARWCHVHHDKLAKHDLWMESWDATPGWVHLTTRAPRSGKREFQP